jgi:hypothetical protein
MTTRSPRSRRSDVARSSIEARTARDASLAVLRFAGVTRRRGGERSLGASTGIASGLSLCVRAETRRRGEWEKSNPKVLGVALLSSSRHTLRVRRVKMQSQNGRAASRGETAPGRERASRSSCHADASRSPPADARAGGAGARSSPNAGSFGRWTSCERTGTLRSADREAAGGDSRKTPCPAPRGPRALDQPRSPLRRVGGEDEAIRLEGDLVGRADDPPSRRIEQRLARHQAVCMLRSTMPSRGRRSKVRSW